MEFPVVEVRRNDSNGQKLLTVPKESDIYEGDKVRLMNLGKNREMIPDYLKTHQDIDDIRGMIMGMKGIGEEAEKYLRSALEHLDSAQEIIEENNAVYADVEEEKLQESCIHKRIVRKEDKGGWRCTDCGKAIPLDL